MSTAWLVDRVADGGGGAGPSPADRLIGRRLDRSHSHAEQPACKRKEQTMAACGHTRIEACERHEDDMHCVGWVCADCGQQGLGECHHQSWCDPHFCGAEPVPFEASTLSTVGG